MTRRLPDGGLDPLADHELVGPNRRRHAVLARRAASRTRARSTPSSRVLTDKIDAEVLEAGAAAGKLRVVANVAVGFDNIDVARRTRTRHRRVQHARRARRDDRRPRVHVDPRGVAAAPRRRSRPARRSLARVGHHAVSRPRRARRDARHRRLRPHRARGCAPRVRASTCGCCTTPATDTGEPGYVADLDELLADLRHRVAARAGRRRDPPPDRRPPARADEADRGAREHRARSGGRRSSARRRAARGPLVRGRARRVRARARSASPAAQRAAHGGAAAHRLGVAGHPHAHGDGWPARRSPRC